MWKILPRRVTTIAVVFGNGPPLTFGKVRPPSLPVFRSQFALFETLIFRISDYRGRIMLSFTTLQGWTSLIHDINAGAETHKKRYSRLMDEYLPYEQISKNRSRCKIWYFWTQDNPFIPPDMLDDLATRPKTEQLARALAS